jgi:hypothetical protein
MEIFVFPELLYPLVLANIMSPVIWTWRDDPWFSEIHKKRSFTWKVNRIKQYIMEHFVFNLDLETWGLTRKNTEIDRFSGFIDMDTLRQSNALFGYEGDKYYFSIDIRRHFGLDQFDSEVIPYWKTETVEAMTAFRHRESFTTGAGECVSLSALYAAALFIVGRIPLEHIFLISTPLHSQNFIDHNEGVLTNNRRIVTKKMWFNGTSLSTRARRALENEKVTMVSHLSGYIHYVFDKATIDPRAYAHLSEQLGKFLSTGLTPALFINFLRYHMKFKKSFQYRHILNGRPRYIGLETIFEYEHSTKINFSEGTTDALLQEIEEEEFSLTPLKKRIVIQNVETYLVGNPDAGTEEIVTFFAEQTRIADCTDLENIQMLITDLHDFLHVRPKLPEPSRNFVRGPALPLHTNQSREEIIELIIDKSQESETALLALYAYRQMDKIDWKPYIKAALERNPVSMEGLSGKSAEEAWQHILSFPNESIYDGPRLAQPDEVWNFQRGDGVEKAFVLANYIHALNPETRMELTVDHTQVQVIAGTASYQFISDKNLEKRVILDKID